MSPPDFAAGDGIGAAFARLRATFAAAGLKEATIDARALMLAATSRSPLSLLVDPEAPLGEGPAVRLGAFAARRLSGEPVDRIMGRRAFMGLDFIVSPGALAPRPDSETVVKAALAAIDAGPGRAAPLALLDLGVGSGCLLLSLLDSLPQAFGVGVDREASAIAAAADNIAELGLMGRAALVRGDWATAIAGRFDLIVANPPYIATRVIPTLDVEVREHDPRAALDGGVDGLDAYRAIAPALPDLLAQEGLAVLEIGFDQGETAADILRAAGLQVEPPRLDGGGRPRALVIRR